MYSQHSAEGRNCRNRSSQISVDSLSCAFCRIFNRNASFRAGWRMINELFTWLLSFFLVVAQFVIVVYQLVSLADLELDHINPHDATSRINNVVVPEFVLHGVLTSLFLITGHWYMLLLCIPCLYYNVKLYLDRKHLVDQTDIFAVLNRERNKRLFKLGYLAIIIMVALFLLIWNAIGDHEHIHGHENIHSQEHIYNHGHMHI